MQNIGVAFVKMGQYSDAITSFEHIMSESPNFKTGFNLLLCYFSLGDRSKMHSAFQQLLTVDLKIADEEKYITHGVSYKCREREGTRGNQDGSGEMGGRMREREREREQT